MALQAEIGRAEGFRYSEDRDEILAIGSWGVAEADLQEAGRANRA